MFWVVLPSLRLHRLAGLLLEDGKLSYQPPPKVYIYVFPAKWKIGEKWLKGALTNNFLDDWAIISPALQHISLYNLTTHSKSSLFITSKQEYLFQNPPYGLDMLTSNLFSSRGLTLSTLPVELNYNKMTSCLYLPSKSLSHTPWMFSELLSPSWC